MPLALVPSEIAINSLLNMAPFGLVLPLLLMLAISTIASPNHNCTHPMPELMKMSSGIDITKVDLSPLLGAPDDNHGFVANVFDYTCTGRKFRSYSSRLSKSTEYDRPDQVSAYHSASHKFEINFEINVLGWRELLMRRLGLDLVEDRIGTLSNSSKYLSWLKVHFQSDKELGQIILPPTILVVMNESFLWKSLSADFIERVAKLPAKYEDNPAIYRQFVQHFGTHYFERGWLTYEGCVQFALDSTYTRAQFEVKENMKQFYNDWSKRKVFSMEPQYASLLNIDKLKRNSEIVLAYGPGDSIWSDRVSGLSYESKDLQKFRDPFLNRATLKPIDELIGLIEQNNSNSTSSSGLQSQVKIAIRMYRIEAYLAELNNVYNFCAGYQLEDCEQWKLDKVQKLVNSHNVTQMDQIEEMIDELYMKINHRKCAKSELFNDN